MPNLTNKLAIATAVEFPARRGCGWMAKPSVTFGNYMPKQFNGVEAAFGLYTKKYLNIRTKDIGPDFKSCTKLL